MAKIYPSPIYQKRENGQSVSALGWPKKWPKRENGQNVSVPNWPETKNEKNIPVPNWSINKKGERMQGFIIENISNLYQIKNDNKVYEATARGKFKKDDITPVVGDFVQFEIVDEENKKAVITEIEERKVYIKRPKLANITQLIFVYLIDHHLLLYDSSILNLTVNHYLYSYHSYSFEFYLPIDDWHEYVLSSFY